MPRIARKSDGRRIFSDEFKHKQIARVLRGELTMAELSRKLGIARSLLQRWKRFMPRSVETVGSTGSHMKLRDTLGTAEYIRELQLLIGKQAVDLELLRAKVAAIKKGRRSRGDPGA